MKNILNILTVLAVASAAVAVPPPDDAPVRDILDAIRKQETGGEKDPDAAVGDKGKSIGAYQIQYAYWLDAVEKNPALKKRGYEAVKDSKYAEEIIIAYMTRYAPNWNPETIMRIHNAGPKGHKKKSSVKYWREARQYLPENLR